MNKFLTSVKALLCVWLLLSAFMQNAVAGTVTGQVQTPSGGPFANATFSFTLTQPALVSGTATVAPATVNCYTDANGNVVGEPNPLVIPTTSANLGSGTLGAATYFVKITYFDGTGESVASPEATLILSGTGTLVVTAPTRQPTGASGYKVYISTATGTETLQGTVTGTPGTWGNFSQASALGAGTALPGSNTTSCKMRFNDELQPSFVCYDVGLISSSGATLPGYPQYWYLSGGTGGTVNIGVGTPQSTVCQGSGVSYPQSIVAQPIGNATQSISGGLDLGTNLFNAGPGSFTTLSASAAVTLAGPKPWIDPTHATYGAKCDGVTDDTTALNAALAVAIANAGSLVLPENKTCIVATSSSPALNADEAPNVSIVSGVAGGESSRPGGGTTLGSRLLFTGTPAIAIGARGSFGFGLKRVIVQASNAAFAGTLLDTSHFPGDTRCGGGACDTEGAAIVSNTFQGTSTTCATAVSFNQTIESAAINNHFFGCGNQLAGAANSLGYSNVIRVWGNDFNASTGVNNMILNGGESWSVLGNTFEINGSNAATMGNSGGYADLTALDFSGNWDGDDVGAGAYTKYTFPANTTGSFTNNLVSATRAAATGFVIGNNSRLSFFGNTFVPGSTVGTLYSIGTGDILNIGPQNYATLSTFMSGTPAAGSIVTDNTGKTTPYGLNTQTASSGNTVTLLNTQDISGPLTGTGADVVVYTYTLPANTLRSSTGIRVTIYWIHGTGTAAVAYKLKFGAAAQPISTSLSTTGGFTATALIMNKGATNSQRLTSTVLSTAGVAALVTGNLGSEDTTAPVTISFTFSVANTDQVTGGQFLVELIQ